MFYDNFAVVAFSGLIMSWWRVTWSCSTDQYAVYEEQQAWVILEFGSLKNTLKGGRLSNILDLPRS